MSDKIELIGSPLGGYSLLPHDKWWISYVNPDGSLNMPRLEEILRQIANAGMNGFRDFPWWLQSAEEMPVLSGILPDGKGGYTLSENYFQNQRAIAETAATYNLNYYYCIFNNSETRDRDDCYTPWAQFDGKRDYFYRLNSSQDHGYAPASDSPVGKWISAVWENFKGMDNVSFDLINEGSYTYPERIAALYLYCIDIGIPARRLSIGLDYGMKKVNAKFKPIYKRFSKYIENKKGETFYKNNVKRPMGSWNHFHDIDTGRLETYWTDGLEPGKEIPKGGARPVWYSTDGTRIDGMRPTTAQVFDMAKLIMDTKSRKVDPKGTIAIEVLYGKETEVSDPAAAMLGLSLAYYEHTGEWPENYGKFPAPDDSPIDTDVDVAWGLLSEAAQNGLDIVEKIEKAVILLDGYRVNNPTITPELISLLEQAGREAYAAKVLGIDSIEQCEKAMALINNYNERVKS